MAPCWHPETVNGRLSVNPTQIIARKRDGHRLTQEEIAFFVRGYTEETIPDYQMASLAMAIFHQGMATEETAFLTDEMLASGRVLTWPPGGKKKVDKHSTGGIGDKVSILLAPLLACCGLQVPMISGRGLGATGGTLDKLEAIPGFRTDLSLEEMQRIADDVGCVISSASADLAPADRKLYALRDVTGTVPSIPLITASIMSKKLAEGLDALVLDVKCGSGAFMKSPQQAADLARSLVDTGRRMGIAISALLTDMNQPLGRTAGNALEVDESVAALAGDGPPDLMTITLALSGELLRLTDHVPTRAAGEALLQQKLDSGEALEKLREMVAAQGGNLDAPRPLAEESTVLADRSGYVHAIDTEALGFAIIEMGGGRKVKTDAIDHSVGLELLTRLGDPIDVGTPLARLYCPAARRPLIAEAVRKAFVCQEAAVSPPPLFLGQIS